MRKAVCAHIIVSTDCFLFGGVLMIRCYRHVGDCLKKICFGIVALVGACVLTPIVLSAVSAWLSFETYEVFFGRDCALGLVIALFCHEMGHIFAARVVGVRASMPYFLPMLGAVVCLKRRVMSTAYEAVIALGGPALGSISVCIFLAAYLWTEERIYLLWSHLGAWLNLLNLLPCYPLDGSRIGDAVSRHMWIVGIVLATVCFCIWEHIMFLLLLFGALWRWWRTAGRTERVHLPHCAWILGWYLLLSLLLGYLTMMTETLLWR